MNEKTTKQTIVKKVKIPKLSEEDGQAEKLEDRRINVKKGLKPFFGKDVNDPSERGHD
tara:strand:- start:470 stop:643 length:174 start_codon:yes stop_codon:yes gene_type:complete